MQLITFKDIQPQVGKETCIAAQAVLCGQVQLGAQCSVWPFAILRGDLAPIKIGDQSNIQENVVVHVSRNVDVIVGDRVTVGHGAIIHGCHIDSDCLIGMHSTILDGAHIGHHCIIGAHTLITENMEIPPYSMVLGVPGKVVRALTEKDIALIENSAQGYVKGLPHFPF